jgi:prephenate dehydrogenase
MTRGTLCLIGLGLMGGSIALDAKKSGWRVFGVGRPETLRKARRRRMIDAAFPYEHLEAAVSGADLVILCVPIGRILELLPMVLRSAKPGAIVTDVGGTKEKIVALASRHRRKGVTFIGGHPIAGTEHHGIESAQAGLFRAQPWIITTPIKKLPPVYRSFLRLLDARPFHLTPQAHDALYARVSHLPHLIAFTMMNQLSITEARRLEPFAGPTYRGMTRVAGSPAANWVDTVLTQGPGLDRAIREFEASWKKMRAALKKDGGRDFFSAAAKRRRALVE